MKNLYFVLISLFCLNSCNTNETCPNCNCDNVDDCLSNYKFEEARKYAVSYPEGGWLQGKKYEYSKSEAFYKIINTEVDYWLSQNELEKAKNTARELSANYGEDGKKKYFGILLVIINKYCQKQQFDLAKELVAEFPEKNVKTTTETDITGKGGEDPVSYCQNNYQKIKVHLESNQEIESYRGCGFNYKILTWEYPRAEASKIIDEYIKQ